MLWIRLHYHCGHQSSFAPPLLSRGFTINLTLLTKGVSTRMWYLHQLSCHLFGFGVFSSSQKTLWLWSESSLVLCVPFSLCSPKCRNARPRCANVCQSLWQKWWNPADVLSKSGNVDKSNTSHAENDRLQMRSTLNYCGELKSVTSSRRICKYVILQIVRAILLLAHLLINILK